MGMKELRKSGELDNLEVSNEINAASIVIDADDGQEWLIQFKNETHNHPTEIEPFGGSDLSRWLHSGSPFRSLVFTRP